MVWSPSLGGVTPAVMSPAEEAVAGDLLEAIRASLHFHRLSEEDMKMIYEGFRELIDKIEDGNAE